MKAVHIFRRIDRAEHRIRVDVRGKRKLHENSVDVVVRVQSGDDVQ
jgi:hypothetical protein